MNTNLVRKYKFSRMFVNILSIFVILAMAFPTTSIVHAASSPFLGHWNAIDVDGSDIRLTIAGRPDGPFQITWTENYLSFCNGEAGIVRGTGWLVEGNASILEADLHVECFTTDAEMDFHMVWRYHPLTNTLSSRYDSGVVTIWKRPGGGNQPLPPGLNLRVMYRDDWVESFYEAGHTAWITVTEADGVTVKATAEVTTAPRDEWGGETGFQTRPEDWVPAQPDIQPNDWVFGWVDNGASAQVQIGDIQAAIDMETDSVRGTVLADWFTEDLFIICDPWGLADPSQYRESSVYPDGIDTFECSWSEVLDILPGQELGVWYYGSDGHAVSNGFSTSRASIHASVTGDFFFVTDFNPGLLSISIYESAQDGAALLWNAEVETDERGFVHIGSDVHGLDLVQGNYLVIFDGRISKALLLEFISLETFDTQYDLMAGTAPLGIEVMVVAAPGPEAEVQTVLSVLADPETGVWQADFGSIGFDITEDMRGWSFASITDEDGDTNETSFLPPPPSPRFSVFPEWDYIEAWDWPDGALVTATVNDKPRCDAQGTSGHPNWDPNALFVSFWLPDDCDVVVGDIVTLTDGDVTRIYAVQNLTITTVDKDTNTLTGTADPGTMVHVWPHGYNELLPTAAEDGNWLADFSDTGPDLVEGMGGRTEVRDELGNATAVEWNIPNPVIIAHPDQEWVEGWAFENGSEVLLTIYNAEGVQLYQGSAIAAPPDWDPQNPSAFVRFDLEYDLKSGDHLWMTDSISTKDMVVTDLMPIGVDPGGQIVHGVAAPNSEVTLEHQGNMWTVMSDPDGNWSATLPTVSRGSDVLASQWDEDGDMTRIAFHIPNPHFTVFPEWDAVDSYEWTEGSVLHLEIDDTNTPEAPDYEQYQPVVSAPWDPNQFWAQFQFWDGLYDVKPGDQVKLSDGVTVGPYIVETLSVITINVADGSITGLAEPNEVVYLWPHGFNGQVSAIADANGVWVADLAAAGINLQPDLAGFAEVRDDMGNATAVEWRVPLP